MRSRTTAAALAALTATLLAAPAAAANCTMTFTLSGWSAFYKTASGEGTVTCGGRSAKVALKVTGGGFSFGSSSFEGKGTFTGVRELSDVFGGYFRMAAEGGPSGAYSYTKGPVRLTVAGTGSGFTVGWDMGNLTISRR